MSKPTISVSIITRDEGENIGKAIESVSFADQIVVADTGSGDGTQRIAKNAGAEVYDIPFTGYGAAKNKALEFCRCDWVLSIDADERVSPILAEEIVKAANRENGPDFYSVNRLAYFLGKPVYHSGWFPDYVVRFFRRGYKFSEKSVHEKLAVEGEPARLSGLLHHHSYTSLEQYIDKMNAYTMLNSRQMHEDGKKGRLLDLFIHPPATFFKMYIARLGILDGYTGFLLATLSSFHVFAKYAKLRQLTIKNSQ